jgi:glycosyltransferase involved in cell wall biosynthesis
VDILVTLTYYHPHWTGLTMIARHLAEGLAARGHNVTVLASQHEPDLPRREEINGVQVVRVPSIGRISRTVVMPSFPVALARLAASNQVVHLHTPMPEALLVVGQARLMGRPSLITHQGDVVMPAGAMNGLIQRGMDASIGLGMRLADGVVVHAADYASHSEFLAPIAHRVGSIYPPVVLPPPRPDAVRAWRAQLGLEGRRLVGFAGRFVEEKGFDFLLQAVPLVRERLPDAHFVFAGDTEIAYERFFDRCRVLLDAHRGSVTQLGLLRDRQQLADFYALCDVFVLPSRSDSFAMVQVEAVLSGTVTSLVSVCEPSPTGTPARGSSSTSLATWSRFWCQWPPPPRGGLPEPRTPTRLGVPARRGRPLGRPRTAPGRQLHPAGRPGR